MASWDSHEDDDDEGPRPSELYGEHTWEIDNYSQITERELRSNVFEAGSYKWAGLVWIFAVYIEFHPKGYGVSNNVSLFLCVANADKLFPGWSHLAHFAIGVVNKDSKNSYYFDGLHRFRKKSYERGWSQFMELSKLEDEFIDDDTLIIQTYVQVIRERADRPFPCLDPQYRGVLIGWHWTKVEQIIHDFVEERLAKVRRSTEDISRWSSLCAFWSNVDPASRRRMSLVKMDSILKAIVKHVFIETEVTSSLVMDSIYNGLKVLKGQHKGKKSKANAEEDLSVHFIHIEKDSFILAGVDDALQLLERAASGPFPPKHEEGPQDEAAAEEFDEDTDERDERRLTELGRQAIEIFILKRIFSKIEAAVNGTQSSPLWLDSDEDEDDDRGHRPSELYGEHTWEINNYSQITKRELRSNVFEAGSYKWYIEFHPEGYGVSNNVSVFLCVANADKLLPGWRHLAHFAIGVVNKASKNSYYYDGLHRFWKKSYERGWSRFMEPSELEDGFIDDDTLIIQAYVQVIRERADRPFPSLDPEYRGVLIGWHRTKVEQIFHDFVEERLAKLRKLTEDISRWSSLCAFWSIMDPASRRRMSLVKMDSILKVIVKHFFIETEVTSSLVMDSIYNGLKSLRGQHKGKKSKAKAVHSHIAEDLSVHFIRIENDSFMLVEVDDALQLLERATSATFPPKDEKHPQDEEAVEERPLTELGRQAIEIFVLEQIFREIEAAMNGSPSSPLCLESDEDKDEDDSRGPKPSELYEKHTWEIKTYSKITKTCLRSKAFEAGGCKWFVEVYPEGYYASNHLSLFLCVANADKLLPGWSHLVYFEIGVVAKDPKKSRYFDGLHRFWKKSYEWGWSQLMELSELEDGLIDDDTLIIEAYVQVIRENADGLFRCLDPHLRGLVVGRYRTRVEQILHDFVEDRLAKLRKLTQDISRWSSFCAFWSNVDPASRRRMSRVEMDSILKLIVKHFRIESRDAVFVTDSLYNGLKALKEGQHKGNESEDKAVHSHTEEEDLSVRFIRKEKDSFVLAEVDDALQLLERAKDEKGPQDGAAAKELIEETIESHERRLTESGRQAIEMFVLSQIFSKIEAAYEEDVAFKAG